MPKIKVVTVDDSKLMQELLWKMLATDPDIRIVGAASDPYEAREIIKKENPDVLTLDVMMPEMDGLTFLRNLMNLRPMPVIMISSLIQEKSHIALEALEMGAVDYLSKPTQKDLEDLGEYKKHLIETVKMAASSKIRPKEERVLLRRDTLDARIDEIFKKSKLLHHELIAIGASTGGVEAIESVLGHLPKIMPAILIVQHIRHEFSRAFARRINQYSNLIVCEASENMEILPGHVYVASANAHLTVQKKGISYFCHLNDTPPFSGHRPSVDVLFNSVANAAGEYGIGVLLTGMGRDGADGLKAIQEAGGATIAQDERTSVVWGMPGAAVKINAADYVVPLNEISQKILNILELKTKKMG